MATPHHDTQSGKSDARSPAKSGKRTKPPRRDVSAIQLATELSNGASNGKLLHVDDRLLVVDLYKSLGWSRYKISQQLGMTERNISRDFGLLRKQNRFRLSDDTIAEQAGEGIRELDLAAEHLTAILQSKDTPPLLKIKAARELAQIGTARLATMSAVTGQVAASQQLDAADPQEPVLSSHELLAEAARLNDVDQLGKSRPQLNAPATPKDEGDQ